MNRKHSKKSKKRGLKGPLLAASVVVTLGGWVALAGGDAAKGLSVSTSDWSGPWTLEGAAGPAELPAIPTVVPTPDLYSIGLEPLRLTPSGGTRETPGISVPARRRLLIRTRSSR